MKKQLLLFVMMLLPIVAKADAVEIDGIYYNLIAKGKVAEVTSKSNKYSGSVIIPEMVTYESEDYFVTGIRDHAFQGNKDLTSITIPNVVTSIGDYAFSNCSGLISVTIPNSLTIIGESTFYNCSALTSITIPNSVTSIGKSAFSGCQKLTSISIPNSVTSIGDYAFSICSGLTSVTIPNSVTSIGEGAFSVCFGLTSITIPNSVTSIGKKAFYGCSKLTSITIPNSVTIIGESTFYNCSALTSIIIPNSVTSIDGMAFYGCTGLASITMGNSLKIIGNSAFSGCSSITSVNIPNSVTSIVNGAFYGCTGLTTITMGKSMKIICSRAFEGCSGLTSITIPNSVTNIDAKAFYGCSGITSVTIGSGIQSIGYQAFADCSNLTDVYCYAENVPNTVSDAFENSYIGYATLRVPSASVNVYKATEPWKNFKSIVAIDGDTPTTWKCEKPTISYENGQLKFASATEDVQYVSNITDSDIKAFYSATILLTATYNITVYATKTGYENSEEATATLCWIDQEPETEGIINDVAEVRALPVLIQSEGGVVSVQGVDSDTEVRVYTVNGTMVGSTVAKDGNAQISTNLLPGSVAIVKFGTKSVKIVM